MIHRLLFRSLACSLVLTGCMVPIAVSAEGILSVDPYVNLIQAWDDNLFRFSDKRLAEAAFGSDQTSDRMSITEAGARFTAEPGRQKLSAVFNFSKNHFERFDFLNNDGYYRNLSWDWKLGSHFYGEFADSEQREMSGFDDNRIPALNQRTTHRTALSANWQFHPRWRVGMQREEIRQKNSLQIFSVTDREDLINQAGLTYMTPESNQISFDLRQVDTDFLNRDAFTSLLFGEKNQRRDIGVGAVWNVGGKTRLDGRLSRIEQKFDDQPERDVRELVGRLGMRWQVTGKVSISAEGVREIYPIDDLLASYVKSDSIFFSPLWQVTSKVLLQARWEHERRDFLGFGVVSSTQRQDETDTMSLSASYLPHEKINVALTWAKEERESNLPGFGFQAETINASLRIDF